MLEKIWVSNETLCLAKDLAIFFPLAWNTTAKRVRGMTTKIKSRAAEEAETPKKKNTNPNARHTLIMLNGML